MKIFLLCLIVQLQLLLGLAFIPQVAFECGRPALYMTSKGWMHDFRQDCLQGDQESAIVKYCQNRYPQLEIVNAEPSPKKVKIVNWCDISSKTCQFDRDVTTFICLNKEFQSDALTLNENCAFGHVTNKMKCMDYRDLRKQAHEECSGNNKVVDSIGMTFPCEGDNGQPMHFYGVEFVCCSKKETKDIPIKHMFVPQIQNTIEQQPIVTSVSEEQMNYEKVHRKMKEEMKQKFSQILEDYQINNKRIMKMEKLEPKEAELERKDLRNKFIKLYNSFMDQYLQNEVKLFNYHDNRLRFIFLTRLKHVENQYELALQNNDKDEAIKWAGEILDVVHTRRADLKKEIELISKQNYDFKMNLTERYKHLASYVGKLLDKSDDKGFIGTQVKKAIQSHVPKKNKSHLRTYNVQFFIDINGIMDGKSSSQIPIAPKRPDTPSGPMRRQEIPHIKRGKPIIHYNLGLNDPDQAKHRQAFSHHSTSGMILIFVLSGALIFVILVVLVLVVYRTCGPSTSMYRTQVPWQRLSSNNDADLNNKTRKMSDSLRATGFGMYKDSVKMDMNENSNDTCHILENPSYVLVGDVLAKEDDLPPAGIHSNI